MANVTITACSLESATYKVAGYNFPVFILNCDFSQQPVANDNIYLVNPLVANELVKINGKQVFGGYFGGYDAGIYNVPTTVLTDTSNNLTFGISRAGRVNSWVEYRVNVRYNGNTCAIGGVPANGYSTSEYAPIIFMRDNSTGKFLYQSGGSSILPYFFLSNNAGDFVLNTPILYINVSIDNLRETTLATKYFIFGGFIDSLPNLIPDNADPYAAGGTSAPSQATGSFDLSSDSVDFPALPTLTAVSTGLVTIYTPDLQQINSLATYLWNADPTTVDWWKKLVANPLDLILGLSIVPVAVPTSGPDSVKVGLIDTQVTMNKASTQFVEVPCGSINITEFYGGALDYSPYRKTSIYLPFIGTRLLSTDDIMGKTVEVKYHIDLLSGALVALVKCGDAVLYQFAGACAVSLPLSGQTFTDTILSTIQLAAAGTAFVATGGFGLTGGAAVAAAAGGGAALASNVMTSKPTIERAGGVSGAAGQLGIMTPYLIGEIPRQSVPENYNTFVGYPSNIKATLGDLTGFTSVESIHLQNIPATAAEYAEIEQLLKEGVIL